MLPGNSLTKALVVGANGQDGSYLVQELSKRDYFVVGVGRSDGFLSNCSTKKSKYYSLDLNRTEELAVLLDNEAPDLVFHVAAVHGSAGFSYDARWADVYNVNLETTHLILDHFRRNNQAGRFVFASSSKVFGADLQGLVKADHPKKPDCIYGISKLASCQVIEYYRKKYGINATAIHFFNHESPRRGDTYFIPQLVKALAEAIATRDSVAEFHSLSFFADWGSAEEFMTIAVDLAEKSDVAELCLATGRTVWAADLADSLFEQHGLDRQKHLIEHDARERTKANRFRVDIDLLKNLIGHTPQRSVEETCSEILALRYGDIVSGAGVKKG